MIRETHVRSRNFHMDVYEQQGYMHFLSGPLAGCTVTNKSLKDEVIFA